LSSHLWQEREYRFVILAFLVSGDVSFVLS
jgi:hypothetical protein